MKIIGKTATGLLVDATEDELANLCGYAGAWYLERSGHREVLKPGNSIDVCAMYKTLDIIQQQAARVQAAQAALRIAAESLNLPLPILVEANAAIAEHKPE